jgi:hypothetical protein
VFADDFGGGAYAFHAGEVTRKSPLEYGVYECERLMPWQKMQVESFTEFILHVDQVARKLREESGEVLPPHLSDAIRFEAFTPFCVRRRPFTQRQVNAWLAANTKAAKTVAQTIREENRPDLFPILADALEDAGCTSEHVLRACRDGNPQADGDWVLAVLLGRRKGS